MVIISMEKNRTRTTKIYLGDSFGNFRNKVNILKYSFLID